MRRPGLRDPGDKMFSLLHARMRGLGLGKRGNAGLRHGGMGGHEKTGSQRPRRRHETVEAPTFLLKTADEGKDTFLQLKKKNSVEFYYLNSSNMNEGRGLRRMSLFFFFLQKI